MKSRERVLCALNHEEADRVPIDFGAFRPTGIHIGTYARLREHLGLEAVKPRLYDLMQQLAEPDPDKPLTAVSRSRKTARRSPG